jgi:hypothetical protein
MLVIIIKEIYDVINKFSILIFSIFLSIYFFSIGYYFLKNLKKSYYKSNITWLNVVLLNSIFFILSLSYFGYLLTFSQNHQESNRIEKEEYLQFIRIIYILYILLSLMNSIDNIMKSFIIFFTYKNGKINGQYKNAKINQIIQEEKKPKGLKETLIRDSENLNYAETEKHHNFIPYSKIRNFNNNKIFNKKLNIFLQCFYIIIISVVTYFYTNKIFKNILIVTIKYSHILFSVIISSINIKLLHMISNKFETDKLPCSMNRPNKIIHNLISKIIIDFLIFKSVIDMFLSIPCILILITDLSSAHIFFVVINYIIWFSYIIIYSNLLFVLDVNSRIKVNSFMRKIFLTKLFSIKLGSGVSHNINYNYKLIDLDEFKLNERNQKLNFFTVSGSHLIRDSSNIENLQNEYSSSASEKESLEDLEKTKDYLPVNFFLIFKLLSHYFKTNEKVYENCERKILKDFTLVNDKLLNQREQDEQGRVSLESELNKSQSKSQAQSVNMSINLNLNQNQINNISNLSKSAFIMNSGLINNIKLERSQLFYNLEDKDAKLQFDKLQIKFFNLGSGKILDPNTINNEIKNCTSSVAVNLEIENSENFHKKNNTLFTIDSLFSEYLLEIFPNYQLNIKDVISALDTEKNKQIFKTLYERKYTEKTFNQYFSRDTFLNFEIYEPDVIKVCNMKDFIINYNSYIKERSSKWKQTFLPLIIGVYNIKYLDYNKIIILYRHPLAFSPFLLFKYWINVCLQDLGEKVAISTSCAEIIDVKEIEIKDNIYLHRDDHKEVFECLKSDFKFFKNKGIKFFSNFSLNIFIMNEVKNFLSIDTHKRIGNFSNFNNSYNDILNESDSREFFHSIRKTENFRETTIKAIEKNKKEFGSDIMSPLDKLVTNYVVDRRYVIKIYFSDLFNYCDGQGMDNENNDQLSNTKYFSYKNHSHEEDLSFEEHNKYLTLYMKEQIKKIIKCSNSNDEEERDISNKSNLQNSNMTFENI